MFYCQLDYWHFYNDGHELYLTPNGVVLSYVDVPAKYLYFVRRPPHEEDVGAKRWNKRQQQSREERGSVDPESSSDTAAGHNTCRMYMYIHICLYVYIYIYIMSISISIFIPI